MVESTTRARNKNIPVTSWIFFCPVCRVGRSHRVPLHAALLPHMFYERVEGVGIVVRLGGGGCWKRFRPFLMYFGIERCTFLPG